MEVIDNNQKIESKTEKMSSIHSESIDVQSLLSFDEFSDHLKRRIRALKKLQFEKLKIDCELAKDVFDLEIKYAERYVPILEKRRDIINGKLEPNDNECDFTLDEDSEDGHLSHEVKPKLSLREQNETKPLAGIPGFWLLAMRNNQEISSWIEEHDEPVLVHLMDIKVMRTKTPSMLTFEFFFGSNDYFTNKVLTKEYELGFGLDLENPWSLEEFLVLKRKGCEIDWKKGKNVTQEIQKVKHSKKNNSSGTKVVDRISFFDFFKTPKLPTKAKNIDEETQEFLSEDWILAQEFFKAFIPNAVLYLTGDLYDDVDSSESSSSHSEKEKSDSQGSDFEESDVEKSGSQESVSESESDSESESEK
jgi:nucleosome assembly protein 1-like 1